MSLATGSRLGPHEIISLLGAGGMGEVYLAHDTKLNRRVAIKVLPEAYAADPDRIARFHREAQAVAALAHPNIAAIYDLADANGTKYLVLELIEGETLADRLRRGPLPVEEALQVAKQILEALEIAHEKGICHRDLKPANVKLTPDGAVKVLDFGLAKFLQSGTSVGQLTHSPTLSLAGTYPGVILGTAGYMSPEQAKGFEADQRSDIFSFGCILYELLTGRQVFDGETASDILASVLKSDPDLKALPHGLNPPLVEWLKRCLEKNPKKRWHAAADVRHELEAIIGRGVIGEEPRRVSAPDRPLWKRALIPIALMLLGAAIAGYAAWTVKPLPRNPVARFTVTLPDEQRFTNPARQLVAVSPDGTNLVYVANQRLFLRPLSGLEAREITGSQTPLGVLHPTFSPDGLSVAFYSNADRTIKRLPITGGVPVTICAADALYGMSWGEHGMVFGQSGKGILRVSPDGGMPEVIATVNTDEQAEGPQILPDGKTLLYSFKKASDPWDKAQLVVQPLAGGARTPVVTAGADGRYVPTGHLVYALGGVLLAIPFDLGSLTTSGGPVAIVEGVRRGGNAAAVTAASVPATAQFSVSRTGTLVYVPGPVTPLGVGAQLLAIFDRKGPGEPLKLPPAFYSAPRVSPDAKWVAFEIEEERQTDIGVYELASAGAARRLTFGGRNHAPIWSGDSQWVAFQSDRDGDLGIFRQRADGAGTAERLTKPEGGVAHIPQSWSRDGAVLLFTVLKNQQYTLAVLTMNDRRVAAFPMPPSRTLVEAAFSPDGRWIAYQARETGANSTYLQPFPPTGPKFILPVAGGHPYWSRKGDEITLHIGPVQSAWIPVTTSPRLEFGQPEFFTRPGRAEPSPSLFRRNADALPDGRVLGVMPAAQAALGGDATSEIIVVLNWFDELRQRAPAADGRR